MIRLLSVIFLALTFLFVSPTGIQPPNPDAEAATTQQIKWQTPQVLLQADGITITIDGKTFHANDPNVSIHSDPGNPNYTTLEAIWNENDVPMRLFLYFNTDAPQGFWKLYEIRTYNGEANGDWIYYQPAVDGQPVQMPIGDPFTNRGNYAQLWSLPGQNHSGNIRFDNIVLQPFLNQPPMTPLISTSVSLAPLPESITTAATGTIDIDVLTYDFENYYAQTRLKGKLAGLKPNTLYVVWLCRTDMSCSTDFKPQITTDQTGSANFSRLYINPYDGPDRRVSTVRIIEGTSFTPDKPSLIGDYVINASSFTISGTPTSVDENGIFTVNVNLSVSGQAGSTYYLRAAFSHSTTPTSYFGYTKNNGGNWYNGTPTPLDYTQFYQVILDSNASWTGTIEVKPDPASSNYRGAGSYNFKVGRYTSAGSGPTWSDNSTTITITTTQTFKFGRGHNFVGLTVSPIVATGSAYLAEDFLRDLNSSFVPANVPNKQPPSGDKVIQITRWVGNYETHIFGSSFNNFPIVPGEGYFVRTTWRGTAAISGTTSTLSSITIPKSYSMVSFPRTLSGINNAEDLLRAMYSQGIDARQIFRFIGAFDVYGRDGWGIPFPITPGEGYFIRNFGSAGTFTLP